MSSAASAPTPPPGTPVERLLPVEEHYRLLEVWPEGTPLPDPKRVLPVVVEVDGKIVAYWFIFVAFHVEPLWIAPEHRNSPGVAKALWAGVATELLKQGVPETYATISEDDLATNGPMAERLGFRPLPLKLYHLVLGK